MINSFAKMQLSRFTSDSNEIDERLRARLSRGEFISLVLVLCLPFIFAWLSEQGAWKYYDFLIFMQAGNGDLSDNLYPNWIVGIFSLFANIPAPMNYIIWSVICVFCILFATRIFGGHVPLTLLSFQLFYTIGFGQLVPIIIAGLALFWWSAAHKRWHLAGFGLLIAASKYQTGFTLGLFLWLFADLSWQERFKMLIIPTIGTALSLIVSPRWPLEVLDVLLNNPPNTYGSISLWRWIGPFALIFWLPPVLLPLSWKKRVLALAATTAFALPYFQQTDLLTLFVFPIPWQLIAVGNLGFLFPIFEWRILQALVIVPLILYALIIFPEIGRGASEQTNSE